MRTSLVTCDRCGREQTKGLRIERYGIESGWGDLDHHRVFDICEKCRPVVDAAISGVVNAIIVKMEGA